MRYKNLATALSALTARLSGLYAGHTAGRHEPQHKANCPSARLAKCEQQRIAKAVPVHMAVLSHIFSIRSNENIVSSFVVKRQFRPRGGRNTRLRRRDAPPPRIKFNAMSCSLLDAHGSSLLLRFWNHCSSRPSAHMLRCAHSPIQQIGVALLHSHSVAAPLRDRSPQAPADGQASTVCIYCSARSRRSSQPRTHRSSVGDALGKSGKAGLCIGNCSAISVSCRAAF